MALGLKPWHWVCLAFALIAFWESARAGLRDLAIEYRHVLPGARLLEVPQSREFDTLALNLNLGIIGPVYWANSVHMLSDSAQVRWVGWKYELGASLAHVDFFAAHHSQHALDTAHPWSQFPFEHSLGIRWRVYP